MHGYRVLYRTSAELLSDLTASLADKTLPARLRRYASPDLLIIDEFGFYAQRHLTNPNMIVMGSVGFGKSATVKALVRRLKAV